MCPNRDLDPPKRTLAFLPPRGIHAHTHTDKQITPVCFPRYWCTDRACPPESPQKQAFSSRNANITTRSHVECCPNAHVRKRALCAGCGLKRELVLAEMYRTSFLWPHYFTVTSRGELKGTPHALALITGTRRHKSRTQFVSP